MKNWYIKVTKENAEILGKWRTVGLTPALEGKKPYGYLLSGNHHIDGQWVNDIPRNTPEITTEQFLEMYPQFKEKKTI